MRVQNYQRFVLRNKESIVYKADRIGEKVEPCPTTMSILKEGDEKLF